MRSELPADSKIAAIPATEPAYLPPRGASGFAVTSVDSLLSAEELVDKGFTHVLVSTGPIHRFFRTPEENDAKVARLSAWHDALGHDGRLVARFEAPAGPGAELAGATVDIYHNPTIEVFATRP
jgi:hypothetical protein